MTASLQPWNRESSPGSAPADWPAAHKLRQRQAISWREHPDPWYRRDGRGSYSSQYWLTFKQAQKHGGHIKRGEKSTYIVFSDKKVREVEKRDGISKELKIYHFIKSFPVFNWDQTEGVPRKEANAALDPDRDLIDVYVPSSPRCQTRQPTGEREFGLLYAQGRPCEPSTNGYIPDNECIHCHEVHSMATAPATSQAEPLGGRGRVSFGGEEYSFEELVAELTSAYLCAGNGIDNTLENSSAYIQNWLSVLKDDKTMFLKASGKAAAAVEYICGKGAGAAPDS